MYRCEICQELSQPGHCARKHTVYRVKVEERWVQASDNRGCWEQKERQEIEREYQVCTECHSLLATVPLAVVQRRRGRPAINKTQLGSYNKPIRRGQANPPSKVGRPAQPVQPRQPMLREPREMNDTVPEIVEEVEVEVEAVQVLPPKPRRVPIGPSVNDPPK